MAKAFMWIKQLDGWLRLAITIISIGWAASQMNAEQKQTTREVQKIGHRLDTLETKLGETRETVAELKARVKQ